VICISQLQGPVAAVVGRQVADALGYQLVDEEIIQRAAESQGVAVEDLAEVERRRSVMQRILESIALSGGGAEGLMTGMVPVNPSAALAAPDALRALIQKSIHETADAGNVVIVSHAASYALSDRGDVLRVMLTASPDARLAHAAASTGGDAKKAAKLVGEEDAGRASYLKKFYGVDAELPCHYDVVLNAGSLPADVLTDLVVRAASTAR
jgi:cytidylate kinase